MRRRLPRLPFGEHEHSADYAALLVIALFWAVFIALTFYDKPIIRGDALIYTYPLRAAAWEQIRAGEVPLWTPLVLAGYPLLSMAQLGLLYPLTWGYLFLPRHLPEVPYVLAPFLLSPAFTYLYARQIGRSRPASLLAGLAFGYGGVMASITAHSGHLTNSLMWLPLVLVAVERARRSSFRRCLLGATAAYTMSVLNGQGQSFVFVGVIAAVYGLFVGLMTPHVGSDATDNPGRLFSAGWWRAPAVALGAILLSAGVAAFQILETMRAQRRSARSSLTYEIFGEGSQTLRLLWRSSIAPLYYTFEVNAYVTPLAYVLAALAVVGWRRTPGRDTRVHFWAATALIGTLLALGINTPLYRLVYHVPALNLFRVPLRHTFEVTFALAVLAAYGFDFARTIARRRVRRDESSHGELSNDGSSPRAARYGVALLAASVGFAIVWRATLSVAATPESVYDITPSETMFVIWKLLFAVLVLALIWHGSRIDDRRLRAFVLCSAVSLACFVEATMMMHTWWTPPARLASEFAIPSPATEFLRQFPPEANRVYTRVRLGADQSPASPRIDALNLTAPHGLHNVAGYEPLILGRFSRAFGGVGTDSVTPRPDVSLGLSLFDPRSHVLDLLNTRFVVGFSNSATDRVTPLAGFDLDPARWQTAYDEGGVVVLRNERALPRAWLVAEAIATDGETALRRIRGEDLETEFDPRRTALMEVKPEEMIALPNAPVDSSARADLVIYEPARLVIETRAETNTILVLSEIIYPGWQATLDSQPVPIHTTNFLLRGVMVPAGMHRIEMRYTAPAARLGFVISLATLAGLLLLAVFEVRKPKNVSGGR